MAQSISNKLKNIEVYLIGPVGQNLKSLLHQEIITPYQIQSDEVHLILEYYANEHYENIHSPAANRFIVSHDLYNSDMKLLDDFFDNIQILEPDLIILAGLHLLESQPDQIRYLFDFKYLILKKFDKFFQ